MSLAPALVLRRGERERLAELARLPSVPSGLAKRARIVLLAADGKPNAVIARIAGVSRPTVISWRDRYEQGGIRALDDEPRSGRPAEIYEIEVVVATLADDGKPPAGWGSRTGRPGSWPPSRGSPSPAWPGSGASGKSSRTGSRPSSSAPTRNWRRRSATSSDCTWRRRTTPSWSASTSYAKLRITHLM